jgi:hypothetical protein
MASLKAELTAKSEMKKKMQLSVEEDKKQQLVMLKQAAESQSKRE